MDRNTKDITQTNERTPETPRTVGWRTWYPAAGRIVLHKADGWGDVRVAAELGVNRHTCRLWRQCMLGDGPNGLWEVALGLGRKPKAGLAAKIIQATQVTKPKGQTHWSGREMARQQLQHGFRRRFV